ncbi:MAG: sporulation sigma factor SigE, partial [Ruminococcaceae bacterium]|nr:sporulation sigma factor SigE [Oscillospiraceae bacterium]
MNWKQLWDELREWFVRQGLLPCGRVYYISGSDTLPPPLTREREAELLARLDAGEEEAKQELIEHNLRL